MSQQAVNQKTYTRCKMCGHEMLFSCRQIGTGYCHSCGHALLPREIKRRERAEAELEKRKEREWISVKDELPPMFKDVLVWGTQDSQNICPQAWQARRWTNCNKESWFEYLTPCDRQITNVSKWMPLYTTPKRIVYPTLFNVFLALLELAAVIFSRLGLLAAAIATTPFSSFWPWPEATTFAWWLLLVGFQAYCLGCCIEFGCDWLRKKRGTR